MQLGTYVILIGVVTVVRCAKLSADYQEPHDETIFDLAMAPGGFMALSYVTSGSKPHMHRVPRQASAGMNRMRALIGGMFIHGDKNKDGFLSEQEFWNTYRTFDHDGNDQVVLSEFKDTFTSGTIRLPAHLGNPARIAEQIFRKGDKNGDGKLDRNSDAVYILHAFDANHDHKVSLAEYTTHWARVLNRVQQ